MDAVADIGRNPVSKHQVQPEYGDEQADARRDGRTRLARPNSQAYRDREMFLSPVQLTSSRVGNLTQLIHTPLYVMATQIARRQVSVLDGYSGINLVGQRAVRCYDRW